MKKVLVILGPTATGKTDVALQLASKFSGELVSCDSRQVYKGLDVGTGKMPGKISNFQIPISKKEKFWEMDGVKVWMYDVVSPQKQYTVYDYVKDAGKVVDDILKRGKLPIIVGGTGLYLNALLNGFPNLAIPVDLKLRRELEGYSLTELQDKLKSLSEEQWQEMTDSDQKNKRRLLRSIELIPMYPYIKETRNSKFEIRNWNTLIIGLTAPREILNKRIDLRVGSRIDQGMIEEAIRLHTGGLSLMRMKQLGLEYGLLADHLSGKISKEQFSEKLKTKIHQYAKRQMTYFKKYFKEALWFDIEKPNLSATVEKEVKKWYYLGHDKKN